MLSVLVALGMEWVLARPLQCWQVQEAGSVRSSRLSVIFIWCEHLPCNVGREAGVH